MSEDFIYPGLFSTVAFVVWILATELGRRSRLKMQIAFRIRLIESLGGGPEVAAFLKTEAGLRLMRDLTDEPRTGLASRIEATGQRSLVLLSLGGGLGLLAWFGEAGWAPGFTIAASLAAALGTGFALSAVLSWRLASRLDLLRPKGEVAAQGPT